MKLILFAVVGLGLLVLPAGAFALLAVVPASAKVIAALLVGLIVFIPK